MPEMQFVACSDESCPLNQQKSCRAPFIAIDENGRCMIREGGPFANMAQTEQYVEIRECRCQKCASWELDEVHQVGSCGLKESLTFVQKKDEQIGPKCTVIDKQIAQPGFSANV